MAPNAHVMTVSRNGQVSITTETGARWQARRVVLVDLGDRVVLRPLRERPIAELEGRHRGRGPRTDEARGWISRHRAVRLGNR